MPGRCNKRQGCRFLTLLRSPIGCIGRVSVRYILRRYRCLPALSDGVTRMLNFDAYQVLTFDCYGTLIDWEHGILGALRPVLLAHNLHLSEAEILALYAVLESQVETGVYRPYRLVLRQVLEGFG